MVVEEEDLHNRFSIWRPGGGESTTGHGCLPVSNFIKASDSEYMYDKHDDCGSGLDAGPGSGGGVSDARIDAVLAGVAPSRSTSEEGWVMNYHVRSRSHP